MWRPQAYLALGAIFIGVILWNSQAPVPALLRGELAASLLTRTLLFCLVGSAYFSFRSSVRDEGYHALNFVVLALVLVASAAAVRHYLWADRTLHRFIYEGYRIDRQNIERFSTRALADESPEHREGAARAAYQIFGATLAFRTSEGSMAAFQPSDEDRSERAKLQAGEDASEAGFRKIDGLLDAMPATGMMIALIAGGIFLAFLLADVLWLIWLRH